MHLNDPWCYEVDLFALTHVHPILITCNLLDPLLYFPIFYNDNKCCSSANEIYDIKFFPNNVLKNFK